MVKLTIYSNNNPDDPQVVDDTPLDPSEKPPEGEVLETDPGMALSHLQQPLWDLALTKRSWVKGSGDKLKVNVAAVHEQIAENMRGRHALAIVEGKEFIINLSPIKGEMPGMWSTRAFETYYKNRAAKYDDNGTMKRLDPAKIFLDEDDLRVSYEGACWEPDPSKVPVGWFNLWNGFPDIGDAPEGATWQPLKDHIWYYYILPSTEVWDSSLSHAENVRRIEGDTAAGIEPDETALRQAKELYHYLFLWTADLFQHPGRKMGSSIAVQGEQGAGKSLFTEFLTRALGPLAFTTSQNSQLVGAFNSQLDGKILVVSEEAIFSGDKQAASAMKDLITRPKLSVNRKHHAIVERPNYIRIISLSNEEFFIPADQSGDARRFLVLEASDARKGDKDYFDSIFNAMESGGLQKMVADLRALRPEDLGLNWRDLRYAPATRARRKQAAHALSGERAKLFKIVTDGVLQGKTEGGSFYYELNEDEPTIVRSTHMNAALRSGSGKTFGGAAKGPAEAMRKMLGPDVLLPNAVWVTYYESEKHWAADKHDNELTEAEPIKVRATAYKLPSLKDMREALAQKWA